VKEEGESGWTQTFGRAGHSVEVVSGGDSTTNDFGNFENIDISGFKYQDHDGNGFSNTNTGLGGFLIYIDANGSGTFDYTDTNANGRFDTGDVALEIYRLTASDGSYAFTNIGPGTFSIQESTANQTDPTNWIQTGGNNGYSVVAASGDDSTRNNFANVHLGKTNGLTIGFWSNKNGQALITQDDLAYLRGLNLRNPNGTNFDPTTTKQVSDFLTTGKDASNMACMLSAQLIATVLNVRRGNFGTSTAVYVGPGNQMQERNTLGNNLLPALNSHGALSYGAGYVNINTLILKANTELGLYGTSTASMNGGERQYMEALKDVFDAMNNNKSIFVL
jgi:hypothetical protein